MAVCEVNPLLRTDVLLCMVRRDGQTYIPKATVGKQKTAFLSMPMAAIGTGMMLPTTISWTMV